MTVRRRLGVAALTLVLLPTAQASASGRDVLKDCSTNGRLTKKYSQAEYRDALANIPSDLNEYTDCRDQIRAAQLGLSGGGNRGGGGSGGAAGTPAGNAAARDPLATATPRERASVAAAIRAARSSGRADQPVADTLVTPGALAYRDLSSISALPTPLVVLAALIVLLALLAAGYLVLPRVRARHPGA